MVKLLALGAPVNEKPAVTPRRGCKIDEVRELARRIMHPEKLNTEPYFTPHGYEHVVRVVANLKKLLKFMPLGDTHLTYLLYVAAWLHDIGLTEEGVSAWDARYRHHIYGARMVMELYRAGKLPLESERDAAIVASFVFRHNIETVLPGKPGELMHKATSLLRAADVCDLSEARARCNDFGHPASVVRTMIPELIEGEADAEAQWRHWEAHQAIAAVAILRDMPGTGVLIMVIVTDRERAQFQLRRFEEKLAGLKLYGRVRVMISAGSQPA